LSNPPKSKSRRNNKRECFVFVAHASRARRSIPVLLLLAVSVALFERLASADKVTGAIQFENVRPPEGQTFKLENSPTDRRHLPETMAGGVAAFDFDGDGLTDVFFTNGATMPSLAKEGPQHWNRLYRNIGGMQFRDVTAATGLQGSGYSIGAATGDFDNDGHVDLFVAGVQRNILYRNRGDGTFQDVTDKAGIRRSDWSVGGAWLDYDNDGFLDLFVVNYVRWTPAFDEFCGDRARNIRVYCHPRLFAGTTNQLYRNSGQGRFVDVSERSGLTMHVGKGMAVSVADYDADGFPDLFVTNDKVPNFLFHNLRNGQFEETAFESGAALPDAGTEMSSMGADFRDLDNDGMPDIVFTALAGETFPFFRNRGRGTFADSSFESNLGLLSRKYSGWGIGLFDFDNDGVKDIFTANSHVNDNIAAFEGTEYRQRNSVFRNAGKGRFEDVSERSGPEFVQAARAHRGSAFADFDNDGRVDVVTSSLSDTADYWKNASSNSNTWLILKLKGTKSNRDGIGATVRIGDQANHMTTSVGYASSSHFGVHFGTGQQREVDTISIRWPSGIQQTLRKVKTNQVLQVSEAPDRH
jgi:enediyne biosynthesis protein E4